MIALYLLLVVLFLLLNAFFVLAEFAAVKVRSTRIEELAEAEDRRARVLSLVLPRLDEYLSVCQVGITLASIGLGFVGEPAVARVIEPFFSWAGMSSPAVVHSTAILVAYALVSFLHILLGELVPKSIAIRRTEEVALWTASALRFFRILFYVPLLVLNTSANLILRLLGMREMREVQHTEEELRMLLSRSQETGLMSFRRLLICENVFDLGAAKVRDAMRPPEEVRVLVAGAPWEENWKVIRETRFSRFPLLAGTDRPVGIIHVKDLFYLGTERLPGTDLNALVRPYLSAAPDQPLENLLAELQRRRPHVGLVFDAGGKWVGFLTLEDVVEEIMGAIEDEFEVEPPVFLADALTLDRVLLGLEVTSLSEAIRRAVLALPPGAFPLPPERILPPLLQREEALSTYVGHGVALPHARIEGLDRAIVALVRAADRVPAGRSGETADLLFLLLTPAGAPRVHSRLHSRITRLIESEYVAERLRAATTPQEVLDVIRVGDPVAID